MTGDLSIQADQGRELFAKRKSPGKLSYARGFIEAVKTTGLCKN